MRVKQIYLYKTKPKCTLQIELKKKKPQEGALHWKSRPPVSTGLNRVEMLVLPLPHGRRREFLP
jgi:hypothetical protein